MNVIICTKDRYEIYAHAGSRNHIVTTQVVREVHTVADSPRVKTRKAEKAYTEKYALELVLGRSPSHGLLGVLRPLAAARVAAATAIAGEVMAAAARAAARAAVRAEAARTAAARAEAARTEATRTEATRAAVRAEAARAAARAAAREVVARMPEARSQCSRCPVDTPCQVPRPASHFPRSSHPGTRLVRVRVGVRVGS